MKTGGIYYTENGDIAHIMLADEISISGNVYCVGGEVWRVFWNMEGSPERVSKIGEPSYFSGNDEHVPNFTLTEDFCGDKETAQMVIKMTKIRSNI